LGIKTYTPDDVAGLLHISVATVYTKKNRDPESLPPTLEIEGSAKLLFVNIFDWAAERVSRPISVVPQLLPAKIEFEAEKKKRGRPSHKEKVRVHRKGEEIGEVA